MAAGMKEDDRLALAEPPVPDKVDQSGHALSGIDRIEQDAFELGQHADRLDRARRREAVSFADIVAIRHDMLALDGIGHAEKLRRGAGQLEDIVLLLVLRRPHADAEQLDVAVDAGEPGDQAGLRAGAPRRMDEVIDLEAGRVGLHHQFQRRVDIAKRTGRIGTPAGDGIDLAAGGGELFAELRQLAVHVRIRPAALDGGTVENVEQHVGVLRVIEIRLAGTVLQQHVTGHAEPRRRSRRLARMVGLGRPLRDDRIGPLGLRRGHQVFELAGFVAAGREARAIVALDPDLRAVEHPRQVVETLQGSRQMGERDAGKAGKIHREDHLVVLGYF